MGNAPDIGDALLGSSQVSTSDYVCYPHLSFDIMAWSPNAIIYRKKYEMLKCSCFLCLVQVRKITFTGSTAVGKKLMAGSAGTVKRVCIGYEMNVYLQN